MTAEALAEIARAATAPSGPELASEYGDLLRENPRALHRDGGPRHLTASAIVVDAPGEHVALVWHRKGRFWVQPGGHLEAGETSFEAAARREVAEETGLEDLEAVGDGPAVLNRHGLDAAFGACHEHWDVQYLLRTRRSAAEEPLRPSEESPEVVWVPWPLHDPGAAETATLPEGTVPDLAANLRRLGRHLAAQGA
ncbi:NUDIX hydrolase [Brachybacterium sp. J153]|uniref:NUDIX hydrolase n=1 Tax=Brachybacterium sp. J153 TaxID=3116488 RepID=UPI002E7752B3|nr:NUDIX domain-containing protein [Brachybacterium sp. J153]MEE1619255.1 NUDIX domain-containing protein [Brachybacterium sp. J153]